MFLVPPSEEGVTASGPGLALPGRTDVNAAYTTPAREGGRWGVRGGAWRERGRGRGEKV